MVYSDTEIFAAIKQGHIICFPFVPENVKGSSVDVRLGQYYYRTDRLGAHVAYNPRDQADVDRYFRLCEAAPHFEACAALGLAPFTNIARNQLVIVLAPGERILAHTYEFIGILSPGTSEMRARSSVGRNGISVCKCAGWGDPGYYNRWTMEIENTNNGFYVLVVGERIAQIIFHATGPVARAYSTDGKYQTKSDPIQNWKPEMMKPRAYEDAVESLPEPPVRTLLMN